MSPILELGALNLYKFHFEEGLSTLGKNSKNSKSSSFELLHLVWVVVDEEVDARVQDEHEVGDETQDVHPEGLEVRTLIEDTKTVGAVSSLRLGFEDMQEASSVKNLQLKLS